MDPRGPPGPIPAAAWPIDDVVRLQVCGRHGFRPRRFQEHEAHPSRAEFLKHNTLCGSVVIKHAKGVIMIADYAWLRKRADGARSSSPTRPRGRRSPLRPTDDLSGPLG